MASFSHPSPAPRVAMNEKDIGLGFRLRLPPLLALHKPLQISDPHFCTLYNKGKNSFLKEFAVLKKVTFKHLLMDSGKKKYRNRRGSYSFPFTAVKTDHKLRIQKHANFFSDRSGVQNSKIGFIGLKSRCQQGCVPSGSSRRELISLTFPASRGSPPSLAHHSDLCFSFHIFFSDSNPLIPLQKTLLITLTPPG